MALQSVMSRSQDNFNVIVAILRVICCYGVVAAHYGPRLFLSGCAVPVFMFLAFSFWSVHTIDKLIKRLIRIAVPFYFWGTVGLLLRCVHEGTIDWHWVVAQYTLGVYGNSPLWFLSVLMIITVCVYFLQASFRSRKCMISALGVALLFCVLMQYLEIVHKCSVVLKLPYSLEIVMGRFFECFPYAVLGYCLKAMDDNESLICNGAVVLLCLSCVAVWLPQVNGYGYSGLMKLAMCSSVAGVAVVIGRRMAFPSRRANGIIETISSYTPGIYYMHKIVGAALVFFIPSLATAGCVVTMMVFGVSLLGVFALKRIESLRSIVQ